MAVTLDQFVRNLTLSGLASEASIKAFLASLPPEKSPQDGDTLAQLLVQSGKLTRYQAAAVAQGKGKNLLLDQYMVLDKLGQGGMGVVLKAEHRKMKRLVAIKVIAPAAVKSTDAVKRFYREVEAAAKLSHPNIVAAYDANEHAGVHYLVMEYVEGQDLAAILKEHGPLPVRQAVECVLQTARGLQYAHEQGIIHRDIKPGNLLLDKKGTVKILDMGLARMEQAAMEETGGERLTGSGQIMGTGDYMAPEQALDTHRADARSDIYSLGCTLYRLLTGKPPYQGETFTQLFVAHREAPIPSLCAARPDVPAALDAVFQKMIAKYPDERHQTMTEVIADLEAIQGTGRRAGSAEDSSSNEALAFLREFTAGGTATRQRASARVEQTLDHNGHPETGTNIGLKLFQKVRQRKPLAVGLGIGLVAVAALVFFGIVITIRDRTGKKTSIRVPDGSHVVVRKDGQVDVTVEGTGNRGQGTGGNTTPLSRSGTGAGPNSPLSPGGRGVGGEGAAQLQKRFAERLGLPVEQTNSIGMKLALIPPGEFEMGSTPEEIARALEEGKKNKDSQGYFDRVPSEGPRHRVKISRPYYLAVYPVTCAPVPQ